MISVMIDFFDLYSWVVFCDFVEFLFEVRPYTFVCYYVTTVFSNYYHVVIAEEYAVVGFSVFFLHYCILTYGEEYVGSRYIPGLTPGVLFANRMNHPGLTPQGINAILRIALVK